MPVTAATMQPPFPYIAGTQRPSSSRARSPPAEDPERLQYKSSSERLRRQQSNNHPDSPSSNSAYPSHKRLPVPTETKAPAGPYYLHSLSTGQTKYGLHEDESDHHTRSSYAPARMIRKRGAAHAGLDEAIEQEGNDRQTSPIELESWQASSPSQICLCQPVPKIPRPRNAFILYRQHHHADILAQNPGLPNPEISKIAGEHWRKEPEHVKNEWRKLADEEKLRHAEHFPDYRFQPRQKWKYRGDNSPPSERSRCEKCGGRSISGVSSSSTITSPPTTGSSLTRTSSHPPDSAKSIVSVTVPHITQLSLNSPRSVQSPISPTSAPGSQDIIMAETNKRRRYNQYPPGPLVSVQAARRMRDEVGPPVTNIGPNPPTPYPFSPNVARRDSLRQVLFPTPVFTRDGTDLSRQTSQQRSDSRSTIGPPPPRRSVALPPVEEMPPTPRTSTAATNPTGRNITPAGAHPQSSLRLPPLQSPASHQSMESIINVMPYLTKIKILRRIVPPITPQDTTDKSGIPRGIIVAVEGDKNSPMPEVLSGLQEAFERTGEFEVTVIEGPKLPEGISTIGMYIEEIARWHQYAHALRDMVQNPRKDSLPSDKSGMKETITVSDSKAGTTEQDTEMDIDRPKARSITLSTSSKHDSKDTDYHPTPDRRDSTISHTSTASSQFHSSVASRLLDPSSSKIQLILISCYLVGASNAWATALPCTDAYSPPDHWQWAATLWRGVPGPDFTVYVRSEETEQQQEGQMDWQGAARGVEIHEEYGVVVVKTSGKTGAAVLDKGAIRRVAFELGEWARLAAIGKGK